MASDRRLAEVARSLHRASERLWTRVVNPDKYNMAQADIDNLKRLTTEVSRNLTKLKLKVKKK
jgi:ribonuclease HIII